MSIFMNKSSKNYSPAQIEGVYAKRAPWAAVIFTVVALISMAFSFYLIDKTPVWQAYVILAITIIVLILDIIGTISIWRGNTEAGLKYHYWSLHLTPLYTFLVSNTSLILILLMLIAGLFQVYYLHPHSWRRRYQFGPIAASVLIAIIELFSPSFRVSLLETNTASSYFGPAILILLAVSLLIFSAIQLWPGSLRNKLMIVLTSIIILLVGSTAALNYYNAQKETEEDEQQLLLRLNTEYNDDISTLQESAESLSISLADREDIKQLFIAKDRQELIDLLTPVFETLRDQYNIRHLYVEDLDGTVFVRIHNPESFGDDVTYRPTAAAALATRQTISGVDIGPNRIGIRSVSPMFEGGVFIGMLEIGLDYDQSFINDVKAHTGADYTMWVTNATAEPAGLKATENGFPSPLKDIFFYSSTTTSPLPIESDVYLRVLQTGEPEFQYVTVGNEELSVLVAPMLGYGNKIIGILEISVSRADTVATLQSNLRSELFSSMLFLFIGLLLIWFGSRYIVIRPLEELSQTAQQQLEGNLSARANVKTGDELEQLGQTLNAVSSQLQETLQGLEERVAARTKDLATVAEVGTATSTMLETTRLLQTVVDLTKERFNLYHSHIYLLDDAGENLVLAAGAGEPGRIMAAEKRSIPINREQSLVARAARERRGVTVNDVTQAPDFLPNPLLPDTRSELAVPMLVGDTLIGVFDIQSDAVGRFTDSDINIQTTLGAQLASSVQNARSYERSKEQADFEALVNTISQKIQRAASVEDTLQTAIRELGTALGASRVKAIIAGYQNNGSTS